MRLLPLVVLAVASPAHAEPRTHDGLYVRVAIGPGYAWGHLATSPADSASHGAGIATQLAVGYTPAPGLVVGIGTFPSITPSPHYDHVDAGGQHVSATGPFVDWYPDPRGGLHATGGLLVAAGYLDGGDRASHVGFGIGATAGLGWETFISDQWSLGAIARVTAFDLFGVDDSLRAIAPAALLTAAYH